MTDVKISGPVFDGTASRAMHEGAIAIRHRLAEVGEGKVRAAFSGMIRRNHGVFLGTVTSTDTSVTYAWSGSWTRDSDTTPNRLQAVSRTYTMPIVVEDPAIETIVTTADAMYGPWLEGTGSRNQSTRFKGYHGFRLAAQELDAEAEGIADAALQPFVTRCR